MVIQLLITGIAYGCIYCLVSIEYSLLLRASGLVNFAHERFILLGAYVFGGTCVLMLGLPMFFAIPLALIVMAGFSALTAKFIFNPLRNMRSNIFAVGGTLMLGKVITEAVRLIWGPIPLRLEGFISGVFHIGDIVIAKVYVVIIIVSVVFLLFQHWLFTYTKMGKAMRCVNQDKVAAELMGINVSRSITITVMLSALVCTIIGVLIIPIFNLDLSMSATIGQKGFAAGVVGGFGTISGSIVGGILIGLAENIFLILGGPSVYKDVVSFVLLIVFLIIKPKGLLVKEQK